MPNVLDKLPFNRDLKPGTRVPRHRLVFYPGKTRAQSMQLVRVAWAVAVHRNGWQFAPYEAASTAAAFSGWQRSPFQSGIGLADLASGHVRQLVET